ncbi:hypothetical protein ACJX0J_018601, partial [Zea mays]
MTLNFMLYKYKCFASDAQVTQNKKTGILGSANIEIYRAKRPEEKKIVKKMVNRKLHTSRFFGDTCLEGRGIFRFKTHTYLISIDAIYLIKQEENCCLEEKHTVRTSFVLDRSILSHEWSLSLYPC